eukprot:gene392-1026_t
MDEEKDLRKYENRLKTFNNWPRESPIFIKDLVEAGYCYTGNRDLVYCFECNVTSGDWSENESPLDRHKTQSPSCLYLANREMERQSKLLALQAATGSSSFPQASSNILRTEDNTDETELDDGTRYFSAPGRSNNGTNTNHRNSSENTEDQNAENCLAISTPQLNIEGIKNNNQIPSKYQSRLDKIGGVGKIVIPEQRYEPLLPQNRPIMTTSNTTTQSTQRFTSGVGVIREVSPNITPPVPRLSSSKSPLLMPQQQIRNPDLANKIDRLHTFLTWPQDAPIQPLELAEAGFFYLGTGDGVRCYKCQIALRNWDEDDTAWGEHQKWSPHCYLVQDYQKSQTQSAPHASTSSLTAASYALPVQDVFHSSVTEHSQPMSLSSQPGSISQYSLGLTSANNVLRIQDYNIVGLHDPNSSSHLQSVTYPNIQAQPIFPNELQQTSAHFSLKDHLSEADINILLDAGFTLDVITEVQKAGYQKYDSYFTSVEAIADAIMHFMEHRNLDGHTRHPSTPIDMPVTSSASLTVSTTTTSAPATQQTGQANETAAEEHAEDTTDLKRELNRVKELQTCKICMDQQVGIVFLPCGHLLTCPTCSTGMQQCPLCRAAIQSSSRIYLS